MLEDVAQFVDGPPDLAFLGLFDLFLQYHSSFIGRLGEVFLHPHHLGQNRHFEFATDDGGSFNSFAHQDRKAIEASGEDGLDGVGQADSAVANMPDAVFLFEQIALCKIFEQLFQVEGIAVGGSLEEFEERLADRPLQVSFRPGA